MTAFAIAGDLTFNPEKDTLIGADGTEITLNPPSGDELPSHGFEQGSTRTHLHCRSLSIVVCPGEDTFQMPPDDGSSVKVEVDPSSQRLQILKRFNAWDGNDLTDAVVLIKVYRCYVILGHAADRICANRSRANARQITSRWRVHG